MKIQKKKFLSNLAKIRIFKKSHPNIYRYFYIFQILHGIFLVYIMIIQADTVFTNSIFAFFKEANKYLNQISYLPCILSGVLSIICLLEIVPLLSISLKEKRSDTQESKIDKQRLLLKISAVFSTIFNFFAILLLVLIVSTIERTDYSTLGANLIHFVTIILYEIIIISCKERLIYSFRLNFLLLSLLFLPNLLAYCIVIIISMYALKSEDSQTLQQIIYLLMIIIAILMILGEQTKTDISSMNFTIVLVSVILAWILTPILCLQDRVEVDNDFLLAIIEKLSKDEELNFQQEMKIISIFHNLQINHKTLIEKENIPISKFESLSLKNIKKQNLNQLLGIKLSIDIKTNPNNLSILIQYYQCKLIDKIFSISTLYEIEKLSLQVESNHRYQDIQRIQSLINKIEVNFLKSEDEINSSLIFRIEKKLEHFYFSIGQSIEELLALWIATSREEVNENIFTNSLSKIIQLQAQSISILEQLKCYKNMSFQTEIFHYSQTLTNVDIKLQTYYQQSKDQYKLMDTKFILISNSYIEDASNFIAKQITSNKEQSLIGMNISQLFYNFYNTYLENELNNIISLSQNHKQLIIPFKIINHNKKFLVCTCVFKILPSLSQGVKYIINFINKKEDVKKYTLYCLQSDTIQGFSSSFFEKYKIDENILPDIIFGREIFNTLLSSQISEDNMIKGMTIKCELKFQDLRKHIKSIRGARHSIPLTLTIQDIYQVKSINYILFQLNSREETVILTANETIKQFVATCKDETVRLTYSELQNKKFCKIRNPLESIIDDKLARINITYRASYFKIIVGIMVVILLVILVALIFIKIDTAQTGTTLSKKLQVLSSTNSLIQNFYQLFYQYYQYYQIDNYPQQLLQIQQYNMTALKEQYYSKANSNIVTLLPLILKNQSPQIIQSYTVQLQSFTMLETTSRIDFVSFLEGVKYALASNNPEFIVKNQHSISKIVDSFVPLDTQNLQQLSTRIFLIFIMVLVLIILLCLIIKLIHMRIAIFKWNILKIYQNITETQMNKYISKLDDFLNLLVHTKYYCKKNSSKSQNRIKIKGFSTKDTFGQKINKLDSKQEITSNKVRGVKKGTFFNQIIQNNLIFLLPIIIGAFFFVFSSLTSQFNEDSSTVLKYSSDLQSLTMMILERATQFYQTSMQAILPIDDRTPWRRQQVLTVPTKIHLQLPKHFVSYKIIQNNVLNYNMCDYSYLNTGSVYKGINCSAILDGMMNKGFTETYSFLMAELEDYAGIAIQDLGKQSRPHATYPFFMEVCYVRRTINNMLAFVQSQFSKAVKGFLTFKQDSLQAVAGAGFAMLPLLLLLMYYYSRGLRSECFFAIKCFQILPRSFIMKIATSKKLQRLGILNEIELIAA